MFFLRIEKQNGNAILFFFVLAESKTRIVAPRRGATLRVFVINFALVLIIRPDSIGE